MGQGPPPLDNSSQPLLFAHPLPGHTCPILGGMVGPAGFEPAFGAIGTWNSTDPGHSRLAVMEIIAFASPLLFAASSVQNWIPFTCWRGRAGGVGPGY